MAIISLKAKGLMSVIALSAPQAIPYEINAKTEGSKINMKAKSINKLVNLNPCSKKKSKI